MRHPQYPFIFIHAKLIMQFPFNHSFALINHFTILIVEAVNYRMPIRIIINIIKGIIVDITVFFPVSSVKVSEPRGIEIIFGRINKAEITKIGIDIRGTFFVDIKGNQ